MATVYRVEHVRSRKGPYKHYVRSGYSGAHAGYGTNRLSDHLGRVLAMSDWNCDDRRPSPREDGAIDTFRPFPKHMLCGFESVDKLVEWFDEALLSLFALNFRVYVYESDDVRYGEKQVLFAPNSRRKLFSRMKDEN